MKFSMFIQPPTPTPRRRTGRPSAAAMCGPATRSHAPASTAPASAAATARSPLPEGAVLVELHQRLHARAEGGPTPRHRRRLDGLEQLALGGAVLDGPAHVGHDALGPAAEGEDADDDHLAVLDRQLLALAGGVVADRLAKARVLRILAVEPLRPRVAVGAPGGARGGLARRLQGGAASGHGGLLGRRGARPPSS